MKKNKDKKELVIESKYKYEAIVATESDFDNNIPELEIVRKNDWTSYSSLKELENKKKVFQQFKIKDIVFLAIISSITLLTCGVMPLVIPLQTWLFGIAQLVTGLQLTIFPVIGLMKTRKIGSMLFIAFFTGIIQLLMAPAMFVTNIIVAVIIELLVAFIFKGYQKNKAIIFAVFLYNPLSLPFNYLYNLAINNSDVTNIAKNRPCLALIMTGAVLVVSAIGVTIGYFIANELEKTGTLKK